MPREGWKDVNIPNGLHQKLKKLVEHRPEFTSVPELVRHILADYVKSQEASP